MTKVINSTSGTVKYRLKDTKARNETSIVLDYSFGRKNRIKFSTGYKVNPKNWDKANQRIRAVSTIKNREKVNSDLQHFSSEFTKSITELEEGQKDDKNILKALLQKIIRGAENSQIELKSFFNYADEFISRKENQSKNIRNVKLSPITVRSYKQTVNRLKDFDKELKYQLDFNKIDLKFYYAFVQHLEQKNYSTNTIGKHIKNLKTILNAATEDGFNTNFKYKHRDFKAVSKESVSIYLTEPEIDALYDVDLSKNKDWELARDIFLVGYYTGQRVSDYNGLNENQIKEFDGIEVIEFNQKKTGKKLYVPMHPRLKELFKVRHNGSPPRELNAPDINEYIKEAGRIAKIDDEIIVEKVTDCKVQNVNVPKYSLIMSHTARRSFCTNAYLAKMPVIDIMAISGHSTEREFYKYIKITPKERAVKISESSFFKN
ncbi:site-specific integrase [Winogradskyella schleiferi]|uniref:site-specific integrase n=1 Tax=Winogradskyella schleiferi TaxID=2686078 RepID=UPI0015BFE4D2|nr:site-specific integrase [Winogradskyella schleiferi]